MALQNANNKPTDGWSSKFSLENTKTSHQLPVLVGKPANINYSVLKQLCSIEGLGNRRDDSSKDAHETFMGNYSRIFHHNDEKLPVLDLKPHSITGKLHNGSLKTLHSESQQEIFIPHDHHEPHFCGNYSSKMNHNITDHLAVLHKQRITQSSENLSTKVKILKRLLKKLPFERKQCDKDAIFSHLLYFTELTDLIPSQILRELSGIIQIEKWDDAGYTVFSNDEINLILKGSVTPINEKKLAIMYETKVQLPTEEEKQTDVEKLVAGQCFGRFSSEHNNQQRTISSVITLSPCEFIKITKREIERMKQVVEGKETKQKLQLVQSCRLFENWPKVALSKVVDLIGWKAFHPGQVLVNEGESCEVIGFIHQGVCLLKRSIDVVKPHRDGTKGRRQKQVIVGKLGVGDSFGECTLLRDQVIPYSVVTASYVRLGIISQHDFNEVEEVIKSLLSQCYDELDNNMSEEELQKQYIKQQKQDEWVKFKRNILREVIMYRSILPGYGKWSRNPTMQDAAQLAYHT